MSIQIIIKVKKINGTSFVGVRNYTNKYGEVSNQTFVVGINYANMLKKDLQKMKEISTLRKVVKMFSKHDKKLVKTAYNEIISSLEKRMMSEEEKQKLFLSGDKVMNYSNGQKGAYTPIAKGLKAKDNQLYIYGLCVRRTVKIKGVYKPTKRREKTIVKSKMKYFSNLSEKKFKIFKVGNISELKIQGITI